MQQYETIKVQRDGFVATILLNRPKQLNAISLEMYQELTKVLGELGKDDGIKAAILTGAGRYYCAGNDLRNFMRAEDPQQFAKQGRQLMVDFVNAFIQFPKVLIAAVNGPAVGISVTTLALCDLVYATREATFHTPFMSLAQTPEGTSSFSLPRIMGHQRAFELLILNRKMTAATLQQYGLINEVCENQAALVEKVQSVAATIGAYPPKAIQLGKQLLRGDVNRRDLVEANNREGDVLMERWVSEECAEAIVSFFSRKSKM